MLAGDSPHIGGWGADLIPGPAPTGAGWSLGGHRAGGCTVAAALVVRRGVEQAEAVRGAHGIGAGVAVQLGQDG